MNASILTAGMLIAAGLSVTGCNLSSTKANQPDPTGVYQLVEVDGKSIPAEISHEGVALEVRSGSMSFNSDGTCDSITVFVPPSGSEVTREVSARYKQHGASLTMNWENAGSTAGTIADDTFTMNNEGMIFVYRK